MGKVSVVRSDKVDARLRAFTRKKADLSRIVEQALEDWLKKEEET